MGPHLSDEVLGIQPGTTQTGSLQATQHPRNSFVRLPNCRIITRLSGDDSPGRIKWTALTWPAGKLLPSHLTTLSEFFVDQSCVVLAIWLFLGATSCSNNNAELTGFAEARRWICFFILRGKRVLFFFTTNSKHAARVTLGVDHARRNIASARQCIELLLRSKCLFSVSLFIMLLVMQVILGLGAVAPPVPAECLRPYVVARNEAGPACRLRLGVPPAWLPVATTTQVSTTATAAKGGDLQLTMETINYQGTGSFPQPPPALDDWMPTTPLVSLPPGFQSLLWTTLSRVDPWRNQLTCSASRHATLVFHLHADWESGPEFLEQLSRRSPGPALGSDQRSRRQSDKFHVLSWNLVLHVARIRVPWQLTSMDNGT